MSNDARQKEFKMFKKVKCVYLADGENSTTQSPICGIEDFTGDLSQEVLRCVSYDNDMKIKIPKYEVKEIWLPEWLAVDEYCQNYINWKFLWAYHKKSAQMSETAQRALIEISGEMKYWLVQLVASDTRSPFRTNLKEQVLVWCAKKMNNDTPYAQPLSGKQMDCIIGNKWNYKATSEGVSRSNVGVQIESLA